MYIANSLVSIIVTAKNEEAVIGRLIKSLKKQSYTNREIIVVDNNSFDKTPLIAKKLGAKVVNMGPERSAQRNFGAKIAKGNYFFFLDADMELTKDVVSECLKAFKSDAKIGALSIPEESIARTFWEKVKAFERSFYNLEGDAVTDAARFFSKKVFNGSGGYDTAITGPEDWDLRNRILKAAYRIGRIKSLIYHYERIPTLGDLMKKKYYYSLKSHRYLSKHKVSLISPETIYFLRPVFYKNITRLIIHPVLTLGLILVLSAELLAGGLGYFIGRIKRL